MNKFSRWVDKFCGTHRNFGIPNLMMFVVVGNVLVWLFSAMDTTGTLYNMLYFNPYAIFSKGEIWRIVTFVFVPNSSGLSLLITLYFYYFIGSTLERHWGSGRFTMYYISGIVFNVLYGAIMYWVFSYNIVLSSYYMNMAMFFAFALMYPDTVVLLFFVIPIKMKWLAMLDAVIFAMAVVTSSFPVNLIPIVGTLNLFLFCWEDIMAISRPHKVRNSPTRVNFNKEVKRMKRDEVTRDFTRKCEVCGRTDRDYPELEFRYCSRCEGYHCYCIDHINNHVHK